MRTLLILAGCCAMVTFGHAYAQQEVIVGLKPNRDKVHAYADDRDASPIKSVSANSLNGRSIPVLETTLNQDRVKVDLEGEKLWLDRNPLKLEANSMQANCLVVSSGQGSATVGAGRGANRGCNVR